MKNFFENWLGFIFAVVCLGLLLLLLTHVPRDDTDPATGRSGLTLMIDALTGCQYLYRMGAITPRMNAEGKQVCVKDK